MKTLTTISGRQIKVAPDAKKENIRMKRDIILKYAGIPEKRVQPGIFLQSVGAKYVHLLSIWDKTTLYTMTIREFYDKYMI